MIHTRLISGVAFSFAAEMPAWAPNGETVGTAHHLFSVQVGGTDERQLTTGAGQYASPVFRPAFAR